MFGGPKVQQKTPQFAIAGFTDPAQAELARAIAPGSSHITAEALLGYLDATPGANSDIVANMLQAMDEPRAGTTATGVLAGGVSKTRLPPEKQAEFDRIMGVVNERILGQQPVKDWVGTIVDAFLRRKKAGGPFNMGLAGPPGVGKTELFKALALALHGNPEAFVYIDGAKIKTSEDVNKLFGPPPGYAGFSETSQNSPFSKQNLQAKFKGKEPALVLIDEVDKIGDGNPKVQDGFINSFGRLLEQGLSELSNGEPIDIRNGFIGMTSNAGAAASIGLEGDDLQKHFVDAFGSSVPPHIVSRSPYIFGFEPHTKDTMAEVARKLLGDPIRQFVEAGAAEGREFSLRVSDDLLKFLGRLGVNRELGARPMEKWLEFLVRPHLEAMADRAQDGERWVLNLSDIEEITQRTLEVRFKAAKGKYPAGVNRDNFPVSARCENPKPQLFPYQGKLPFNVRAPDLAMAGSGAVGGTAFVLSREGDAPTRMHLLRPGATEAEDSWGELKLPPDLATANTDLKVANLDPDRLYFYAVNTPEKGDSAEACAYIYDATSKQFTKSAPPPLPLIGAAMVAHEGQVLLYGGRVQNRDETGEWSVTDDAAKLAGRPIENQALLLDTTKAAQKWQFLAGAPGRGRVGAAGIDKEGIGYLLGGEATRRAAHNGLDGSVASNEVTRFDFATRTFSEGASLSSGVAFATPFLSSSGEINLAAGITYTGPSGRQPVPLGHLQTLGARGWRSESLGGTGHGVAVVPHSEDACLVGPVRDASGRSSMLILRPRRDDE